MKTKARKKITSLLVAAALVIAFVAPTVATRVQAAEIGKPSDIVVDRTGVAATGNTIMFGVNRLQSLDFNGNPIDTPDGNPIKWRVVANDGTTITLMADNKLGNRWYDATEHEKWSGSDICNYLNGTGTYANAGFLQSSFSTGERSAMVAQYSTTVEQGCHASDTYTANQTIVLPSVTEMKNSGTWGFTNGTERQLNPQDDWWLRSAGGNFNYAAVVNNVGTVSSYGDFVNFDYGIRPALKIHLSSVIFSSSAASGGKPTTVGAKLEAASPPGAEIKLTVKDPNTSNLDLTIADTTARTALQGETITIPYTGAKTGTGKYVSCVVEDSTGVIKYYAKLADTTSDTAKIDIPATMPAGSYTIRLFNEQCNGNNETDFASDPISIGLTVQAPVSPTINGTATGNTNRTVPLGYSDPENIDFTVAGTPTPTVTVADGGTGATISGNRLTIPTGLGVSDYTITLTATNSQGSATHKVNFKVSALPIVYHTITVNASTGGTVSGGGSYAENDTATVIATPDTGWSFKHWTENGIVVSTDANYNFAVTADRTLIANFKAGDAPEPKPTPSPSYSGGSSDNYVGSNKADTSPNLKPAVTGRPFTKAEATKLFNTALAAKPAEQPTLSFRAQNYTKAEKSAFAELAALAQKNGVTLTVHFDSVVGKAVTYRVSVNPALVQTDLDLTAKIAVGKLTLPKFPVPVEIAVKMPAGVTMETLKITQNGKDITATAKPWLDKVGYLHFTTTGGEMVLGK